MVSSQLWLPVTRERHIRREEHNFVFVCLLGRRLGVETR
jgi:hypothetical protein